MDSEKEKNNIYYLAVDIGASSGRHILGSLQDGKIVLEEMYRFPNGMKEDNGVLYWDTNALFEEIICGLKKCAEAGKTPSFMGIDTWGVDYVLLDKDDRILGRAYGYRDSRTAEMPEKVSEIISSEELYGRTGIQKQLFNTIYQLMAVKCQEPESLERAENLLLMPDYLGFLLTGQKKTEYTNASTTQLLDPVAHDWDRELIEKLGYPQKIFGNICKPGTVLGHFSEAIRNRTGFDCTVIMPATHDTGSAVMAVPAAEGPVLYISSGTWSLMGTETKDPNCSEESRKLNLTNEGGFEYRIRYLKNIMGLWMIQSVQKESDEEYSFAKISEMASLQKIGSLVDCNDNRFLAPANMTNEIRDYCRETGQQIPENLWETAAVIYNSLAKCYSETVKEIETMTNQRFTKIHVVGGGSNAAYLNRLTAQYSGLDVYAGPSEATATGNIAAQMISNGVFDTLQEARRCIMDSFEIQIYRSE